MVDHIPYNPLTANNWTRAYLETQRERPWAFGRLVESMNASQVEGKLWLGNELINLNVVPEHVALLAGWYAHYITAILVDNVGAKYVTNFEIDHDAHFISFKFNRRYKDEPRKYRSMRRDVMFKSLRYCRDLNDVQDKHAQVYDVVVNTSCEHMFPMWKFREINPQLENSLFVLQSTSQKENCPDHINTVESVDELIEQARMMDVWYSGSKKLLNGFERFMVIGK